MKVKLSDYLTREFSPTEKDLQLFIETFKAIKANKNELLVAKDDLCKYVYFVCEGSVRAYFIDEDGKEATRYIALEGQFITTIHSFISQTPTNEYIEATENCELLQISYSDFRRLSEETQLARDLYKKQLELAYISNHGRIESFLKMTAKQRYDDLMQKNPAIVRRISNKIVASYLGITQESLSRLKSQR